MKFYKIKCIFTLSPQHKWKCILMESFSVHTFFYTFCLTLALFQTVHNPYKMGITTILVATP
jgi:hypothetical protein